MHGMTGPIDGKKYEAGTMVPAATLGQGSDEQIAAVLSYLRQSWGNVAPVIEPKAIATIRTTSAGRKQPWTLKELENYAAPPLSDRTKWIGSASRNSNFAAQVVTSKTRAKCDLQNRPGNWFAVDLGETKTITQITLDAQSKDRYPRAWELRISEDGKTWTEPIASGVGDGSITTIDIEPKNIRHLRIVQTGESKHHRWSVATITIHGR